MRDLEVPQPAKQATPPRPVAPPAPANLSYADRVKLSAAAASPGPAPAAQTAAPAAAPAPPAAAAGGADHAAANGGHAEARAAMQQQATTGVFCKGLPAVSLLAVVCVCHRLAGS